VGQTIPGIVTAGEQLQDVPKFTHSAWLDLEQPLSGRLSLIGRVSNSYYGASRDTGYKPAYDLVSWRLGVASEKTWSAEVYMDNVTNRVAYLSNTISLAANIPTLDRIATNRPRTTGLAVKYQF
jgi:outer membrane receptor protein involved in Fe transport